VKPKTSSAEIIFECDDYATEEYKAQYEFQSFPSTIVHKCKSSPCVFPNLNDGFTYRFSCRSFNKEGKSKWCDRSIQVTPVKIPPEPMNLRCASTSNEITLFWICEDLKAVEYSGWFEVDCNPGNIRMVVTRPQARFRGLRNDIAYRFQVSSCNDVGRTASEWSDYIAPNTKITKEQYIRDKKNIACDIRENIRKKLKQKKKKKLKLQHKIMKKESKH